MSHTQFYPMPGGRRIAFRHAPGSGDPRPALVFLPGYMSDMAGGKATALFEHARAQGRECLLLDYSGCGESSGDFADGTLSRWCEEVVALIESTTDGRRGHWPSMGGWLMLLVGLALKGWPGWSALLPPDFTEGPQRRRQALLAAGETVYDNNPYGPEPTPTHPGFYADGQATFSWTGRSRSAARCGCCTGSATPTYRGKSACALRKRSALPMS